MPFWKEITGQSSRPEPQAPGQALYHSLAGPKDTLRKGKEFKVEGCSSCRIQGLGFRVQGIGLGHRIVDTSCLGFMEPYTKKE